MCAIAIGVSPAFGAFSQSYADKLKSISPGNLLAYWILNEITGTTLDNAEGTAARDGTSLRDISVMGTDAGIGDGNTAPDFDGANDAVNIYSASLDGAFDPAEFSIAAWAKVEAAAWTDSQTRSIIHLEADASNQIDIQKAAANNKLLFQYVGGGVTDNVSNLSMTTTTWFHVGLSVSKSADELKAFLNGSQEGSTQSGLGVWAGGLNAVRCALGSRRGTVASWPFDGLIAHAAVFDAILTPAQFAQLATA